MNRWVYRFFHGAPLLREDDPVSAREWLLRRISPASNYYIPNLPVPTQATAFRPNDKDVDGISLFREMFVSPVSLSKTGRKPPYIVIRVRAQNVLNQGLSIHPFRNDEIPGHVSIPEMNWNRKSLIGQNQMSLARSATCAFDPAALTRWNRVKKKIGEILATLWKGANSVLIGIASSQTHFI